MMNITKESRIESTATIAAGLMVFHYFFVIKEGGDSLVLFYIALGIIISGLFVKPLGDLISFLWAKLAEGLGWFNSKVILSIAFFIVMTPFALLYRVFTKDNLGLKRKDSSYYETRDHQYSKKDLQNIW
jgi:hypothetical protein